jgi:hypothetical protein
MKNISANGPALLAPRGNWLNRHNPISASDANRHVVGVTIPEALLAEQVISIGGSHAKVAADWTLPHEGLFAAVHESAHVQVFGCRNAETIHALRRPASEKRQGTKSRLGGAEGAAVSMAIWPRLGARRGWGEAVDAIALRQGVGAGARVTPRVALSATRLAVRQRANLAGRREHGRCRPIDSENGGYRCGGGSAVTAS